MSQSSFKHATIDQFTYTPPSLPGYLAKVYTLKVIVGVPVEEEVKDIHDVIRALNGLSSSVPALYDPQLSTQLAQHLFSVQMAVYRNEYPSSIFPTENTYTPPPMPSHIPISLGPVVGAPSDEGLNSAHKVVRAMENLANNPLFEFDSGLSVKLSQHLFNIQFARYIQDLSQGNFASRHPQPASPLPSNEVEPSFPDDRMELQGQYDVAITAPNSNASTISRAPIPGRAVPESLSTLPSNGTLDRFCAAQEETNRLLSGNEELLRDIRRTLVSTESLNLPNKRTSYQTMNEKGELPWMHNLPYVSTHYGNGPILSQKVSEQKLVGYLRFYNIGADLFEEETESLKPGREADAQYRLAHYLYWGHAK